jgi:hypothetical protein
MGRMELILLAGAFLGVVGVVAAAVQAIDVLTGNDGGDASRRRDPQ